MRVEVCLLVILHRKVLMKNLADDVMAFDAQVIIKKVMQNTLLVILC